MSITKFIVLGGGCFWCTEAMFKRINGVISVESGYSGGTTSNPTYEEVCEGDTGHAEVIKITYDPDIININKIVGIHLNSHDPTTLNRQGPDIGTQYRSVIFYNDKEEKKIIENIIKDLSCKFTNPIITEVKPFQVFYKAENYHQNYFAENPGNPYCNMFVSNKINKFETKFYGLLKRDIKNH